MGGEELHEQDREEDPGHHRRSVEESIKAGFGTDAAPDANTGEVQFGEGQLDVQEAKL